MFLKAEIVLRWDWFSHSWHINVNYGHWLGAASFIDLYFFGNVLFNVYEKWYQLVNTQPVIVLIIRTTLYPHLCQINGGRCCT